MSEPRQAARRWLAGIAIAIVFLVAINALEKLATLALLSFLVAYALNPLVTRLERLRFLNRTAATALVLSVLLLLFLTMLLIILPAVYAEFQIFAGTLPGRLARARDALVPIAERLLGVDIPDTLADVFDKLRVELGAMGPKMIGPATDLAAAVFGGTFSVIFAIVGSLMFPLFLFFLLKDFPRVVNAVDDLVPLRNKAHIHVIAEEVDASLSNFLHGQFLVMIVLGTLYSIGYSIAGIPIAIGVGLLTGLLCFIPYVGAATGFAIALLLSLLEFEGAHRVVGVIVTFGTVQLLDTVLITPRILGGKLGLRPLWIIVALMAGAELFGFLGVLLAVPAMAVLKVLAAHGAERYKRSSLYRDVDSHPPGPPPETDSDGAR